MRRYLTLPFLVAALALSACGDDNSSSDETAAAPTEEAQSAPTEAPPAEETPPAEEAPTEEAPAEPAEGDNGIKVTGKLGEKPKIDVSGADEAPAGLVYKDLEVGDGKEAEPGTSVNVQYVGALLDDGTEFDASWDRGTEPFTFTLGQGMVIPGWDQGVAGMKEGGRRLLVIPSDLGYGDAGAGGVIGPGATLVFVVDLEKVSSP